RADRCTARGWRRPRSRARPARRARETRCRSPTARGRGRKRRARPPDVHRRACRRYIIIRVMGTVFTALLLWTDFWRSVAPSPYDDAIAQGTRLARAAEEVCRGCSEAHPRFAEMQGLWRQAAAAFRRAAALHPEEAESAYLAAHA